MHNFEEKIVKIEDFILMLQNKMRHYDDIVVGFNEFKPIVLDNIRTNQNNFSSIEKNTYNFLKYCGENYVRYPYLEDKFIKVNATFSDEVMNLKSANSTLKTTANDLLISNTTLNTKISNLQNESAITKKNMLYVDDMQKITLEELKEKLNSKDHVELKNQVKVLREKQAFNVVETEKNLSDLKLLLENKVERKSLQIDFDMLKLGIECLVNDFKKTEDIQKMQKLDFEKTFAIIFDLVKHILDDVNSKFDLIQKNTPENNDKIIEDMKNKLNLSELDAKNANLRSTNNESKLRILEKKLEYVLLKMESKV